MKRILLVDDDLDLLRIVRHVVSTNGYEITTVSDEQQMWEGLNKTVPDLIILDVDLGNSDGMMVCRKLKNNESTKKVPVLMFSAEMPDKNSQQTTGANAYMQKPVSSAAFLQQIKDLLN